MRNREGRIRGGAAAADDDGIEKLGYLLCLCEPILGNQTHIEPKLLIWSVIDHSYV